ncbi:MAG: gluconate 2-dehydrogenase subunit 3 family protein [Myxococcales bacterium]
MAGKRRVSRREFLGGLAVAGGGLALASCRRPPKVAGPAGQSLTAEELALCAAACERVLPADQDPGARDLGVVDYIDRRLARPAKRASRQRRKLKKGLAQLESWSDKRNGRSFLALDADAQDDTLASFAAEGGDEGYAFVHQLVLLTMEGAFADPVYGGNRDKAGWKLIGFDAPCPNPRCG